MKPKLLDLFCGAGGAGAGYVRAGFDVVGIDIRPQPRYPFAFVQADAMIYPLDGFDAIHASPPCTDHTPIRTAEQPHGTAWMLEATIARLTVSGLPYVVENVVGAAKHMPGAVMLCGESFGIHGLCRHRLFLSNVALVVPPRACRPHPVGIYGELSKNDRHLGHRADGYRRGVRAGVETARRLLGCPWMDGPELSQAIPPVYCEFIGGQLLAAMSMAGAR